MTPVVLPPEILAPPPVAKPPEKPPRRRWAAGIVLLILIGGGAGAWWLWQQFQSSRTPVHVVKRHKVERGILDIRKRVTGSTAAKEFANITAPLLRGPDSNEPMTLMTLATAGHVIRKGEMVAAFDPQQMRDHLDDTRDGLKDQVNAVQKRAAELRLEQALLAQRLAVAKGTLDKARLDLKTSEVRSAIDAEKFRLAVEEAEAVYKSVQEEVRQQTASQTAALRIVEITRDLEVLHVKRHEADLSHLKVFAPIDGLMVIEAESRRSGEQKLFDVGAAMRPGTLFARVVNPKSMLVEAAINQSELEQFRVGQMAMVRLDAFPELVLKARLESIGALASNQSRREQFYVRSVPVTFQILDTDERVLPGLSAAADVLVDRIEDALLVPAGAVEVENGQTYVQMQTPHGVQKRPVTAGPGDGRRVSILSGVEEGDVLIVE